MQNRKEWPLIRILFLYVGSVFLISTIIIIVLINIQMRNQALADAESKALMLIDHNLATHTYFTHQLKPKVFAISRDVMPENYFEPVWMSSTFAVRGLMTYFQELNPSGYYYKECAVNARSEDNEADAYEKEFLNDVNSDPELLTRSAIRDLDGTKYFTLLRRGETMEESCLRCHTTPERAPADMVALYGSERSFNRSVGEVLSAVSIRIPLSEAYATANLFSLKLSLLLVFVLVCKFGALYWISKRYMLSPLYKIKNAALLIAASKEHLGQTIEKPDGKELIDLALAFNEMSRSLKRGRDELEQKVEERTRELTETNTQLRREKDNLKQAADEIKTLRGILPICSSCKKIRDDKGSWSQIESYIHKHSEADFTHGICPDCAKKLYPDIDLS